MKPSQYEMKSDGKHDIGLIAQELQPIIPEAVSNVGYKLGISYEKLIPVLIKAIQEQQIEINKLKKIIKK